MYINSNALKTGRFWHYLMSVTSSVVILKTGYVYHAVSALNVFRWYWMTSHCLDWSRTSTRTPPTTLRLFFLCVNAWSARPRHLPTTLIQRRWRRNARREWILKTATTVSLLIKCRFCGYTRWFTGWCKQIGEIYSFKQIRGSLFFYLDDCTFFFSSVAWTLFMSLSQQLMWCCEAVNYKMLFTNICQ